MENTNIVTTEQQAPNTISASNAIFNVQALGQLTAFANLMADSQVTVPAHLAETSRLYGYRHAGYAMGHEPLRCGSENTPG